jgi:hypothetical protein
MNSKTTTDTGYRLVPPLSIKLYMKQAKEIRAEADKDEEMGILYAAKYIIVHVLKKIPDGVTELDVETANTIVRQFVQHLLDKDQFEAAATILWGPDVYDWRPKSSRDTWRCLFKHDRVLVQGAGAMGKSFGAAAWFYLDWFRDPEYTSIKVVSLTREHAERNIFASIKNFHRTALVRPVITEEEKATSIQATPDSKNGIHLVAIPKGESGHGTLRGFHPTPRFGKEHAKWGRLSRTHVVLDEAEEIPAGVWEGINNIISTADAERKGHIKIFAASNPKDRTSDFGQRCEPKDGWGSIDCEDDYEWESKEGFHVLRLDAARCENVIEKRIVYQGLQTYQGYMGYMARGRTAEAMTMARGWFPEEGMAMSIITPAMMDNSLGVVRFIGPVVPLAAFDLALEGNDQVMCSYGRFGLSDGWTPQSGKFIDFKKPKTVLQLDSQIPFPKKPTLEQTQAIIRFCKQMKISPNWLVVDRTGNGAGIHDSLCSLFGSEVLGVNYSWASTDTRVLGDDSQKANELYNGVVTELIFGLSKYLEFEYLKISPSFRNEELIRQATARRYKQKGKGMVRVESKGEYCKRTRSKSPDALDSLSMLVFLMRQRAGVTATMTERKAEPRPRTLRGVIESMEFVDFSE